MGDLARAVSFTDVLRAALTVEPDDGTARQMLRWVSETTDLDDIRRRPNMSRFLKMSAVAIAAMALLATAAGCQLASSALGGSQWRLTGWTVSSIDPAAVTITLSFKDGQVSGNSGVNSYGGPYTLGPGGAIEFGPLAMTEMAGPEPAMRAEQAYQALLSQVTAYTITGGELKLYDKNGNEQLIFRPVGE
jgi:heat shock protein HslJ